MDDDEMETYTHSIVMEYVPYMTLFRHKPNEKE